MIHLKTCCLILRNFEMKDLEELCDYRNNELCARYQRWEDEEKKSDGLAQMILERADCSLFGKGKQQFAVAWKKTGEIAGDVTVFLEEPTITLGYTVSYKYHRRGIAFEILSALVASLHEIYPEREIICLVEPENLASIQLLKKLNFEDLGYAAKIQSQVYGRWALPE